MTFLYDARDSVVLLRPKNKAKLRTKSADKWFCMGKRAFKILAELFLKNDKASDDQSFFPQWARYQPPGEKKKSSRKLNEGRRINS